MKDTLTPTQLIKKAILKKITSYYEDFECPNNLETPEHIEAAWDYAEEHDFTQDCKQDFREGEVETPGVKTGWSRHCEIKGVAAKIDEHWIGWEYEYGGGKHFEESGDWLYNAYFLDCKEEEKVVTVRTFSKKG